MAELSREIINDARTFAQESVESADELVGQAVTRSQGQAQAIVPPFEQYFTPGEFDIPEAPEPDQVPTFDPANIERPEAPELRSPIIPSLPDFEGIPRPERINFEDLFNQEAPNLDLPPAPSGVPEVSSPEFPEAPELNFPETPDTVKITIPDEPSVSVPSFDPEDPGKPPGQAPDSRKIIETTYHDVLPEMRAFIDEQVDSYEKRLSPHSQEYMERLEKRLDEMAEGGTALPDNIEQAIFDRTRRRTRAEQEARETEVWQDAAQRGFTMPPGITQAALHRAGTQANNENTTAASDVAIRMAELEQQNIQFALQTMSSLRQAVINATLQYAGTLAQVNGQALEYSRAVAASAIESYNAEVNLFNAKVSYFQAQAQVYEVELRSAFAELEKYRELLRAEQLKSDVNAQIVQQFQSEIQAQETRIRAYATQVDSLSRQIDADRARVEAFGQQVQAYSAQVQAQESKFRVYTAALEGDRAKVDGYAAQVQAFNTEVGALSAQVQAEATQAESVANINQTQANVFASELQAYGVDIDAKNSVHQAEIRRFTSQLDQYQTEVSALRTEYEAQLQRSELEFSEAESKFTRRSETGIENARLFLEKIRSVTDTAIQGAQVHANIAGAAVSAQNTMVSINTQTTGGS